ncbi:alkanesulfonate monooxygenase [Arboricoccus pini]|uniref:Alkanesulfonate monooxygenase n=1 Tax=Arboricoccus pini TaxID=1963835 RepID=A0A212QR17_9PROT|nr:LLM class flavin-dependent oxidoreductase [Arboricoccus pini]SNB61996.1 alkanesulfonate monooxygenase [Arboricoccus pini]
MSYEGPRFGIWALVSGATGSLFHPDDPPDATWERNRRLVLEAEALGYDSTLVAQHLFHVRDERLDQLETWTACAGLAAITSRIEIIAAIKPYLFHPVVLAKMATQIEEISQGRFAINLVNAWYKPEFERAGIPFTDHDDRYAYGREWIDIVRPLMEGRKVNTKGQHFEVSDYQLHPTGRYRPRPLIYAGGESSQARDLAAGVADTWFINGQPPEDVAALIADISRRPRVDAPLRFGLAAFVIARRTDEEAQDELQRAFELAEQDRPYRRQSLDNTDNKAVMFKTFARMPHVGTNGGTAAGLVGSYERVAERIRRFHSLGIDLFMLQFQPFEAEMRRFAHEVMPRVRERSAAA